MSISHSRDVSAGLRLALACCQVLPTDGISRCFAVMQYLHSQQGNATDTPSSIGYVDEGTSRGGHGGQCLRYGFLV